MGLRERLLARARSVQPDPSDEGSSPGEPTAHIKRDIFEQFGADANQRDAAAEDSELSDPNMEGVVEEPATGLARPWVTGSRPKARQLSPTLIAVFGTLMGLVTVTTLVALGMNLDRSRKAQPATVAASRPQPPPDSFQIPKKKRVKLAGPWRIADAKAAPNFRVIEGRVGEQSFLAAVQTAGAPEKEVYRVMVALKGLRNFDQCKKDDRFVALLERGTSRIKAFEYIGGKEEVYQAKEGRDGLLTGSRLDLSVRRERAQGAIVIDAGGFDAAADRAGFESGLSKVLADALDGHEDLDRLEPRTILRVIAQEVTVLGEFARYSGVEAVEIRPPAAGAEPTRIYYFRGPKSHGHFDARGRAPHEGGWRKPIPDAPITSRFNPKRFHPLLKRIMPHTGTDFGAGIGTPVRASSYGIVSFMGPAGPSGNLVTIQHPGGIETGYAHLSRFAEGLKVGDRIKRLEVVGYVGSTGRSTGPHLHFSAKKDGKFIDPETLDLDGMHSLAGDERIEFTRTKAQYDALLDAIALPPLPPPSPAASAVAPSASAPPQIATDEAADEQTEEPGVPAAKSAPAPSASGAPAAAPPAGSNPIYLTDKELLKLQSASDDGEVAR
jgi:hypothetical protein